MKKGIAFTGSCILGFIFLLNILAIQPPSAMAKDISFVPHIARGTHERVAKEDGFENTAQVTMEESGLLFIETDKSIYTPGQTIHVRVTTVAPELFPVTRSVVVDIYDAQGIKIFSEEIETDEYGLAAFDLTISNEPNVRTPDPYIYFQ